MPDNTKRKAILWEKAENNFVKCLICNNYCLIPPGKLSRCFSRKNIDGEMVLNNYGMISSLAVDPIEKKPLYHFYPGSKVLSVGGWGCNFRCKHCQNWQISQIDPKQEGLHQEAYLSPERLVELIPEHSCQGLSWTYNEPSIWLEYVIDSARLAKEKGYYTAFITNGYLTMDALHELAPYMDAYRVDLKSFEDKFYQEICGVKSAKGVYETTLEAKKLGMHVEAVTNIIPTYNDSQENLENIANWIKENLGESTPWHVTRFFPCYQLKNIPPTPIETLEIAEMIGKKAGLNFVYKGNIQEFTPTYCPECGKLAIMRNYSVMVEVSENGHCTECGHDLNIKI